MKQERHMEAAMNAAKVVASKDARLTEATKNAAKVIRGIVKYLGFGPKVLVVRPGILRCVARMKCNNILAENRLRDMEFAIGLETHCYQINPRGFVADSHLERQETDDAYAPAIEWFLCEILRAGSFLHVLFGISTPVAILPILCERTIRQANQGGKKPTKTVAYDVQTAILFMIDAGWVSNDAVIKCLQSIVADRESDIRDAKFVVNHMNRFIDDCK